jgi:hypothetical protein
MVSLLEDARRAFVEKFGREPGPHDPVFFDPDADTPQLIDPLKFKAQTVITMIRAGIPHHLIYTFIRTGGLIVSEEMYRKLSPEDRAVWDNAMAEYDRAFGNRD